MANDNKTLVTMWFEEVWNKGRVEAIDDMMAPNCVIHGLGPQAQDIDAFRLFHAQYRDAFPDINITVDQTADATKINAANLANYKAVVFVNSSGDVLDSPVDGVAPIDVGELFAILDR